MEEKELTTEKIQAMVDLASKYAQEPTVCSACGQEFYVFFTDNPPKHFERCTQHIILSLSIETN